MAEFAPLPALLGGVLIGLAAVSLLWTNGRIAGISGILGGLLAPGDRDAGWRLGFLDAAGRWDPSLALVMAGATGTAALGFRLVLGRRSTPLLAERFSLPPARAVDRRLVAGAAVFGVGWGLAGFCPGPALANLGLAFRPAAVFVAAMLAGMAAFELAGRMRPRTRTWGTRPCEGARPATLR